MPLSTDRVRPRAPSAPRACFAARVALCALCALLAGACGSDADPAGGAHTSPGDAETPPTGEASTISAWLAAGHYAAWRCEAAPHDARDPSPHGRNRICSNAALSTHGDGAFPVGAAAVKELFDDAGSTVIGRAMYRKVAMGAGAAWYWFEETDADGLVANGLGDSGAPKTVCVRCHVSAGRDAAHSGHDFVYTQVR